MALETILEAKAVMEVMVRAAKKSNNESAIRKMHYIFRMKLHTVTYN